MIAPRLRHYGSSSLLLLLLLLLHVFISFRSFHRADEASRNCSAADSSSISIQGPRQQQQAHPRRSLAAAVFWTEFTLCEICPTDAAHSEYMASTCDHSTVPIFLRLLPYEIYFDSVEIIWQNSRIPPATVAFHQQLTTLLWVRFSFFCFLKMIWK